MGDRLGVGDWGKPKTGNRKPGVNQSLAFGDRAAGAVAIKCSLTKVIENP